MVAAALVRQASFKPATGDDAAARCSPRKPPRLGAGGGEEVRGVQHGAEAGPGGRGKKGEAGQEAKVEVEPGPEWEG